MKSILLLFILFFICRAPAKSQQSLQSFQLQQVQLLPGVFKEAQETDRKYILSLDADRLLAPYFKEAGLPAKKNSYENWENTGLNGHIGGHYLSALSFMYAATGDAACGSRLDYMLQELRKCQDKIGTGYLCGTPGGNAMWNEIANGIIQSDSFSLNKKWVPLYNLHKVMAGLRDAYLVAGKRPALKMLIRLTNFIDSISYRLSDEQVQRMLLSEHGGLTEIFAEVSYITGDRKYLLLAKKYSHRLLLDPLLRREDHLTGLHANMQIPKATGFQRISEVGGDSLYGNAARFFWQTVVEHRTVAIGGNSVSEHFNPQNDFQSMINGVDGPETCNTYNMLRLTKRLFEADGRLSYINYYERALFNHILSSERPKTGGFVYYTSMRPGHYRVYSQPQLSMWCCVGSGMENHGKYGELIYSHTKNDLYVNLFIASRLNWKMKGLLLSQQTSFPDSTSTKIVIESVKPGSFGIHLRYPSWVERGKMEIKVNGKHFSITEAPDSYVDIVREWKKGDEINVSFTMKLSSEKLPDGSDYTAFLVGPIVLAAKTSTDDLDNLIDDGNKWGGYRARGKIYSLDSMPVLVYDGNEIEKYLTPVKGSTSVFTAGQLIQPLRYQNLQLIPFYKLHDARYVIYWKTMTAEKYRDWNKSISSH